MRLSRDDDKAGESMSIENQRIILQKYVSEHGGTVIDEYIDDGFSGTNFDRPDVKRMLFDAQSGKIDTIVVKDLSRFGRNYIQVGQYIDYIFPAYGIRFIALNDNVDTADRSSAAMDMMPIMNVFNEWHAANTSKKIRAVLEAKQRAGAYTNWNYPYGYKAGSDDNRTAVIDEDAAKVVRRIFNLRLQGNSARIIARILSSENIPNPATYFKRADGKKSERRCSPLWVPKTVMWILTNPTYIGDVIQHKTTSVSYKNHKVVKVPESERIIKKSAHEPIISRDVWDRVQAVNNSVSRGRVDSESKIHPLSGLIICPDCGKKFKISSYRNKGAEYCFVCRTYADLGKNFCTSHRISESEIERVVLRDIQSMLSCVQIDEQAVKERFIKELTKSNAENRYSDERKLRSLKNRIFELDNLISSAFEAKVLGSMPESVCVSLCTKYQNEKESAERSIAEIKSRLSETAVNGNTVSEYTEKFKRYAKCESLTREMCLELISFITLGEQTLQGREVNIYYKFKSGGNFNNKQ